MPILPRESSEEKKTTQAFVPSKFLMLKNQNNKLRESQLLFKTKCARSFLSF